MLVPSAELLTDAELNGYAVAASRFSSIQLAALLLSRAEALDAPLVLSFSPSLKLSTGIASFPQFIRIVRELASQARIPVALHLDHAQKPGDILEAVDLGFTSLMIDPGQEPGETSFSWTQQIVEHAHAAGVSVESTAGGALQGREKPAGEVQGSMMPDPEQAAEFVHQTGVDALVVEPGMLRGARQKDAGCFLTHLQRLSEAVKVPLVLQNPAGTGEHELRQAITLGIRKINVCPDLLKIPADGVLRLIQDGSVFPMDLFSVQQDAAIDLMDHFLSLSGSIGAAAHWRVSVKERVRALFLQGYTCAEAILIAFAEKEGFASDITQLFSSLLGGGISNQGKLCGGLLGGLAVIGARESSINVLNKPKRRSARKSAAALIESFENQHHALNCIEIIQLDFNIPEQAVLYMESGVIEKTCVPVLFSIVDRLENNH